MKISKKAYYGLRAVLALAQEKKPLSIHTIAKAEHIPEDYLEKILQSLRRADLVTAHKGVAGGYALASSAEKISTWDILRVLDGPIKTFSVPASNARSVAPAGKPVRNTENTSLTGWPCPPSSHCQTNEVWRVLEKQIELTLSDISIEQLISHNHPVKSTKAQMTNVKPN